MRTPRLNLQFLLAAMLTLVLVALTFLGGLRLSAASAIASAGNIDSYPTPEAGRIGPPLDQPQIALPDGYTPSYPNMRGVADIASPTTWRVLLLVYRNTDVDYIEGGVTKHMTTSMSQADIDKALARFNRFKQYVSDYSAGEANIDATVVQISRPVNSITAIGSSYWLSPNDIRNELNTYAPRGTYDSVEALWQSCSSSLNTCIPPFGWGSSVSASDWSNGATYASMIFGWSWWWDWEADSAQLYLHEWLHGAMDFYSSLGYVMPVGGLDSAGEHGYTKSPVDSWATWYRAVMTGQVWEPSLGRYVGITPAAWRRGTITHPTLTISGQVKNALNQPIGGVTISIPSGRSVTTDPTTGRYVMDGLAAGTYTLTPSKSGYTFLPSRPTIVITTDTTQNFIASAVPTDCSGQWRAEYFDTITPQGNPAVVRCDSAIDFYWGNARPTGMPATFPQTDFSVRWQRTFTVVSPALYRFRPFSDDGIRLYHNGMPKFDGETSTDFREYLVDVSLSSGDHEIVWEYRHGTGASMVQVGWYACATGAGDCAVAEHTQQRYQTEYPSVAMPTTCASTQNPTANQTIASKGCLITSYAMLLQHLGVSTDPVELNAWLSEHDGYTGDDCSPVLVYAQIEKFAHDQYGVNLRHVSVTSLAEAKQVIRDEQLPVIYRVNGSSHWVLAADVMQTPTKETLGIFDPHHAWSCWAAPAATAPYSRINCAVGRLDHRIDLTSYPDASPFGYLDLTVQERTPSLQINSKGVELLLTDAQGRRVGYNQETGETLYEIPNSFYVDSQIVAPNGEASGPMQRTLFLPEDAGTAYTLQAIGQVVPSGLATSSMASEFEISVISFDAQFNTAQTTITGDVSPDQTITFQVNIAPGLSVALERETRLYLPLVSRY